MSGSCLSYLLQVANSLEYSTAAIPASAQKSALDMFALMSLTLSVVYNAFKT